MYRRRWGVRAPEGWTATAATMGRTSPRWRVVQACMYRDRFRFSIMCFELCQLLWLSTFKFQVSTFNMQLSSFNMQLSSEFSTLRVRLVTSVLLLYFECLTPTVIQSCVINLKVEVHFEVWNFEVWSWKFWTTKYFELWTFELTLKHELWRLRCSLNWNVWKWTNSFNLIFYRCKARVTIKFVRSLLYGPSMVSGVCWLASLLTSESVWLAGLFD